MQEPVNKTHKMVCRKCHWTGELAASASDRCPRCSHLLQLAPKASQSIMRSAIQRVCNPAEKKPDPITMTRVLVDKDAPKDEGEWEFKLSNGVLEVIAWNDDKTEAQCVRLVRRGFQIHLMHTRQQDDGDGSVIARVS